MFGFKKNPVYMLACSVCRGEDFTYLVKMSAPKKGNAGNIHGLRGRVDGTLKNINMFTPVICTSCKAVNKLTYGTPVSGVSAGAYSGD